MSHGSGWPYVPTRDEKEEATPAQAGRARVAPRRCYVCEAEGVTVDMGAVPLCERCRVNVNENLGE